MTKQNVDDRLKQGDLATISSLDTVLHCANKNKTKMKKLQKFDISCFKDNTYDFSVDCNAVDKSDMLTIHKVLIVRNNINYCLDLLSK